ncbi:MAG: Rieske 2Fe-2S domain-containing protein [Acidobacteriaceae bacterium]|nr:Rieske 2Fe-2S domain-containing protein [Acidobacteriaceae bacterium]
MITGLSSAQTIPATWYTDPQFLVSEKERIFWHTWQPVGHAAKVASPGSYLSAEVVGEPCAIVRGNDGILRAFSNVCRHRASTILEGNGCAKSLRCPYHGWTYSLDGALIAAPEFEGLENWNRGEVRLPSMGIEEWGPFVFVNIDSQAAPLSEVLADIPDQIAAIGCPVNKLHFSYRREYLIRCNWKLYIDNYLEGYHLPAAHPSLFRELDYNQYRVDTFRYYSSQYAPIRPRRPGRDESRRYTSSNGTDRALYFWIFPNFMLNVYPDNLSSNIILPVGHDQTLTIFEWFTYPKAAEAMDISPETVAFSDEIQQEDIRICENVQKGLASRSYDRGRYSVKRENGVYHFHCLVEEFLNAKQFPFREVSVQAPT